MSARLKKVLDFIESSGEPLPGCCSEEEGLALAEKLAPDMAYCTVRNWTIADLDLAEPEKYLFAEQGILPSLLYAERVLTDSACRFSPGDWVRSTPLQRFSDGCLFQTRNTIYVLVGPGCRKTVDPTVVMGFF